MNALRDYQSDLYTGARSALIKNRGVCIQLATGGGKTAVASEMVRSVLTKKKRAWFITPRIALVDQASNHFRKWAVPHGMINSGNNESNAYLIHVVSKDTLVRRWHKIKNWPDLIIIDECHINFDFQIKLAEMAPLTTKLIAFSATPERLDGRGLSVKSGGIYNSLIEGPSIPDLTSRGFLTDLRYFSPPIEGIQNLKRKGYDYDEEQLDDLLARRKVYGEMVGHYEKYGKGKAALIFCRSVKSAYQTAERFRDKGFNFHCIEGEMSHKHRKELINALTKGDIDGLTNCDIATYGLDIPRIEYGASIRPTLSRSLYFQKIGRILRPFTDPVTGYKKEDALFFDHVNLVLEHQEPEYPGIPPHYVPHVKWNFEGVTKRKKKKQDVNIRLCPYLDFMYCQKPTCKGCEHNPNKENPDARRDMIIVPAELQEKEKPIPMAERPESEKREFQDRIGSAVIDYRNDLKSKAVSELLRIAEECGYPVLWVYYRLTEDSRHTINIPLLHEIARQKGYNSGWVYHKKKTIKLQKKESA